MRGQPQHIEPMVILGRDGMGPEATEADFDRWVKYVANNIEREVGFAVYVDCLTFRGGLQVDRYAGDSEPRELMREAVQELWQRWCAEGAP